MKQFLKFLFFYLLSITVHFLFLVSGSKLIELGGTMIVLLNYNIAVLVIMALGYLGMKGLVDEL